MIEELTIETTLLGENTLLEKINQIVTSESTFLVNLYGEQGAGKTEVLKHLHETHNHTYLIQSKEQLEHIEEVVGDLHEQTIFLLDNMDMHYSRESFKEIVLKLYSQHYSIKVLFTSKNRFFLESLPGIQHFTLEVGNRHLTKNEFSEYASTHLGYSGDIPPFVIKNFYLFATHSKDFRSLFNVMQEVRERLEQKSTITQSELIHIIKNSELYERLERELIIDLNNMEDSDFLFVLRPKDKTEKLRDLLMKYYPVESVVYEVMKNQFKSTFVEDTFSMNIPYADKLLNICLSYDPVELLVKLLGPRDIILELNEREIGEAAFTYSIEEKTKLILKSVGMNILDNPKGLDYFIERFENNLQQITLDRFNKMNREYLIGLGISCFQEMESLLYEMINFYGTYFCGSFTRFIQEYNQQQKNTIFEKRITFGQYIGLLSFINKLGKTEDYQLKGLRLDKKVIISSRFITSLEELSSRRTFYSHTQKVQSFNIPYRTYRNKTIELYEQTLETLRLLKELTIFPEIIKIKEIIFDEFGRRLFVATNWKKDEIRFSLSGNISTVDIYSHYYILRKKQLISINPILIPRYLEENIEKFHGEGYDKSSDTQFKQGASLISRVKVGDGESVLDIGCGNGRTTIELYQKNQSAFIEAFDLSESMIEKAIENRIEQGIEEKHLRFFVQDGNKLEEEEKYHLVFSNATLHWMTDSKGMYTKIYNSLKKGGRIAVHQGGSNCYQGLHELVKEAIEKLDLQMYYTNWQYPVYYPKKQEYENLLKGIGFKNVVVDSVETDGKEYPHLVDNFANAGMLPYIGRLPEKSLREKLKKMYFRLAEEKGADQYTHRLFAFAEK